MRLEGYLLRVAFVSCCFLSSSKAANIFCLLLRSSSWCSFFSLAFLDSSLSSTDLCIFKSLFISS